MFFKSFLKRSKKLTLCIKCQTDGEDVVNFCGLLCKQDLWTPIKFSKNIKYVHIILLQFCSLSAIHLNRYHVMHSVVIIFAQDPQLPPPHLHIHLDSRIFPSHAHGIFAKKTILKNLICTTFSVFVNLINFLQYHKDFYDILPTYFRCPSQRGQSLSTFFSLNNFCQTLSALSNFAKRKTSSSDVYFLAILLWLFIKVQIFWEGLNVLDIFHSFYIIP